jgi:anti-sigma regulatory factor (Ser/Thr protein kinase)
MTAAAACTAHRGYRHEAFLYHGPDEFLAGTAAFVREAVAAGEPILVVLGAAKLDALRRELGPDADGVVFADMAEIGANPARIIPAWAEFVERNAAPGRRLWGIGEPIWAERDTAELTECQRHEALLNVAFADPDFVLLCPYDTSTLPADVIEEARRSHPYVRADDRSVESASFPGAQALAAPLDEPLPPPPGDATLLAFGGGGIAGLRRFVHRAGVAAGLSADRVADLVLAVNEIATNSVVHGGGAGTLCVWQEPDRVVCEVRDGGRIEDPLVDRRQPSDDPAASRGLWIANQLCELVQVRAFADGGAVRLHMHLS